MRPRPVYLRGPHRQLLRAGICAFFWPKRLIVNAAPSHAHGTLRKVERQTPDHARVMIVHTDERLLPTRLAHLSRRQRKMLKMWRRHGYPSVMRAIEESTRLARSTSA